MYAKQIGITTSTGFFFTLMAIGMAVSRLFSGKLVDKGMITQVIQAGMYLVCICFFGLSACGWTIEWFQEVTLVIFYLIALLLGIGFGTMFPAYNTLFVNLAPNSQRGTATSTYLTSWDVGIGIGMVVGGYIAEISTFKMAYFAGALLTVLSLFFFIRKVGPHFHEHRLR
jgi:MFS family permease